MEMRSRTCRLHIPLESPTAWYIRYSYSDVLKGLSLIDTAKVTHDTLYLYSYEDVFEDLYKEIQEQQEATAELDGKLDHTMQTVITMGGHATEHHKELIDVKRNLGDVEEKVEEIDEDLGKTKVKVEEIDNKVII